jgi:hypothetical protein
VRASCGLQGFGAGPVGWISCSPWWGKKQPTPGGAGVGVGFVQWTRTKTGSRVGVVVMVAVMEGGR